VQLCHDFAASLGSEMKVIEIGPTETIEDDHFHDQNDVLSDDKDSSADESADAHALGDETLVDDVVADPDVRDEIINVAPGEAQHPLCLYLDKNAEEMANPDIFGGVARPANHYSYKQLCRVELQHFRRWAASRPCNIFFKFRKMQVLDMKQLSWV
jgi:hypothetical protein